MLLAIITQEFSLAVFRLRLNNPLIVQGVKNRLYVIQFTRYRRAFCYTGSFWIISRSKPFVKNFFQVFSNFSEAIFLAPVSVGNSVSLAQMIPFVKNYFTFSSKFLHLSLPAAALADSLRILSYALPFVKDYFTKCDNFFVPSHSKERGLFRGPFPVVFLIPYRRSNRSRRRFAYRQPQRFRRYPHPGRRRNCGPADSSASPLPHGSWV